MEVKIRRLSDGHVFDQRMTVGQLYGTLLPVSLHSITSQRSPYFRFDPPVPTHLLGMKCCRLLGSPFLVDEERLSSDFSSISNFSELQSFVSKWSGQSAPIQHGDFKYIGWYYEKGILGSIKGQLFGTSTTEFIHGLIINKAWFDVVERVGLVIQTETLQNRLILFWSINLFLAIRLKQRRLIVFPVRLMTSA
jgi:hypothetical protein